MQQTFQQKPGDNEKIPPNCSEKIKFNQEFYIQLDVRKQCLLKLRREFATTYSCREKELKDVFREKKIKYRQEKRSNKQ